MYISISRSRGKYKAKKIIGVWHGFRGILKLSRRVNQASLKLHAVYSNDVCWTSLSFFQCDQFLIRAQICKNTGRLRAHFLQKYERFTGKNTSADSQIFNSRPTFLTMPSLRPICCSIVYSKTGKSTFKVQK